MSTDDPDFFILDLGTADFYGLQFADTDEELVLLNDKLRSTPNILIQGSSMILDYSDISDSRDKENIDTTFKSMSVNDGFTLSNAIYNNITRDYVADLAASCTLASYEDYKIIASDCTIGSAAGLDYYLREYFETIPQITTSATLTGGTGTNKIINYTTGADTSFISNNFAQSDYIDFATTENTGRWTIQNIEIDGSGREIVSLLGANIKEENLKGTKVTATHSRKVNLNDAKRYDLGKITTFVVEKKDIDGKFYFTIDGLAQKNLVLFRGNMYVFIENDYPSHTLSFSNTPDGIHSGGAGFSDYGLYTVTDNSVGKRITVMVPNNNFNDTIYYYCAQHAGMGASIRSSGGYTYGSTSPTLDSYSTSLNFSAGIQGSGTY